VGRAVGGHNRLVSPRDFRLQGGPLLHSISMGATADEFSDAQARLLCAYEAVAQSRFVHLKDPPLKAHYLESGDGEPVVLLHGGNSFAASWAPLIQPLAAHFHLYLPDRPGCGLTEKLNYRGVSFREHSAAFVKRFLDAAGVERAALVGNSMGGYFAFAFALAYPERVSRIAALGAIPLINDAMPIPHRMLSIPGLNRWIWSRVSAKRQPPSALYAHPERLLPEVLECARIGGSLEGARESWLTMVEEVGSVFGYRARYNINKEMAGISAPTLFIIGDKDGFGTVESVARVQQRMRAARTIIIPDAAHVPWYDDPTACTRELLSFLSQQE
jgi:pimeloyl-ACP methyl ester carboxylesterase